VKRKAKLLVLNLAAAGFGLLACAALFERDALLERIFNPRLPPEVREILWWPISP
jgi:hypothetical protein